jgi:uncharacterized protein with PIN domain
MSRSILIRFYEELNDFLPEARRKRDFRHSFFGTPTIKDIIESLGVPHTEVDLILANGLSVAFDYKPLEGDMISVYPVFESIDISPVTRLRPKPLRVIRFIADVHLGRLAKYLRMLGFDTHYSNDLEDPVIVRIALKQKRIILTRDLALLKNSMVTHGYYVRSSQPAEQLGEVIRRFDLKDQIKPFKRCMNCNGPIRKISKEKVLHLLRPRTKAHFHEFYQCRDCKKVYWHGSHFDRMNRIIAKLVMKEGET